MNERYVIPPDEITGVAWVLGDHVNTDMLHPPAYFSLDTERMKAGIRAGMKILQAPDTLGGRTDGLIIVAGENFGCGSSRETSVRALIATGVRAVVAQSFARIFYRSLVNLALPPVICAAARTQVRQGARISVSIPGCTVRAGDDLRIESEPMDRHCLEILSCGGLKGYLQREIERRRKGAARGL